MAPQPAAFARALLLLARSRLKEQECVDSLVRACRQVEQHQGQALERRLVHRGVATGKSVSRNVEPTLAEKEEARYSCEPAVESVRSNPVSSISEQRQVASVSRSPPTARNGGHGHTTVLEQIAPPLGYCQLARSYSTSGPSALREDTAVAAEASDSPFDVEVTRGSSGRHESLTRLAAEHDIPGGSREYLTGGGGVGELRISDGAEPCIVDAQGQLRAGQGSERSLEVEEGLRQGSVQALEHLRQVSKAADPLNPLIGAGVLDPSAEIGRSAAGQSEVLEGSLASGSDNAAVSEASGRTKTDAKSKAKDGKKTKSAGELETKQVVVQPMDPQKMWAEMEQRMKERKHHSITASEKEKISGIFKSFRDRGWAADQALALYINSKFFPVAAARFRKLLMRTITPELKESLLAFQRPQDAEMYLFPLFAEFCFNEFPAEIKAYRELVNSADMTKPHTWYPFARAMKRKIIYHRGPTNSGKTFTALQRFRNARSGVYCGPLRLLAMEVYDTVNLDGVYCNLVTGQERKVMPFAEHTACTIEMASLSQSYEVAVVDEIQMITDEYRGWAWTRALLGLQADEVHVCGDSSALPLLRTITAQTGDEFVDYEYERFKPLIVDQRSLVSDFRNVQSGDCIVAFSRREIFDIKRQVETHTPHRCCVVYGALPPETRRQQAKLFNDPGSGYDVLVASDAVGMGLNLNIRRLVFYALHKFNGEEKALIPAPMVKQIAGRAGRRGSLYPEGIATTFRVTDMADLLEGLQQPVEPAASAGLFPFFEQMELFASQLPDATFAQLLGRFVETSRLDGSYFLCKTDNLRRLASMLEKVPGLSLEDRFKFCFAPANTRDPEGMAALLRYARTFAERKPVPLAFSAARMPTSEEMDLMNLETKHQVASLYMWLSQHFPPEVFPHGQQAEQVAGEIAELLAASLAQPSRKQRASMIEDRPRRRRPAKPY